MLIGKVEYGCSDMLLFSAPPQNLWVSRQGVGRQPTDTGCLSRNLSSGIAEIPRLFLLTLIEKQGQNMNSL
jgi:hypothetical protein